MTRRTRDGYETLTLRNPTSKKRVVATKKGTKLSETITLKEDIIQELAPFTEMKLVVNKDGHVIDIESDDVIPTSVNDRVAHKMSSDTIAHSAGDTRTYRPVNDIDTMEEHVTKAKEVYEDVVSDPDRRLGGHRVMGEFSYLRSQRTGEKGLYSEDCFGFKRVEDEGALYEQVRLGYLEVTGCVARGHGGEDVLSMVLKNLTGTAIQSYVPAGMVFEQMKATGNQNIGIPRKIPIEVGPGGTKHLSLPGMCVNSSFGSPNNDQMVLTPFIMPGSEMKGQGGTWGYTDPNVNHSRMDYMARVNERRSRQ